jgi:hypothetical protein
MTTPDRVLGFRVEPEFFRLLQHLAAHLGERPDQFFLSSSASMTMMPLGPRT